MKKNKSEWVRKTPLYLKPSDKGYKRNLKQLKSRGFSDSETWGLDTVIAEFTLPRLKRFKELTNGHPCDLTSEQWGEILDKMIFALESIVKDDEYVDACFPKDYDYSFTTDKNGVLIWDEKRPINFSIYNDMITKRREGLKLFGEYFENLWW